MIVPDLAKPTNAFEGTPLPFFSPYRLGALAIRWFTKVTPGERLYDAEQKVGELLVELYYKGHDLDAERDRRKAAEAFAMDVDEELTAERGAVAELEARVGDLVVRLDEQTALNALLIGQLLHRDELDIELRDGHWS